MTKKKYNQKNHYLIMRHKTKMAYFNMRPIICPLLNNEEVFFKDSGFTHFIRKGSIFRSKEDQLRRFYLFRHVTKVLQSTTATITVKEEDNVTFWGMEEIIATQTIRVVVRQYKGGTKHFFSIMAKSFTKKSP